MDSVKPIAINNLKLHSDQRTAADSEAQLSVSNNRSSTARDDLLRLRAKNDASLLRPMPVLVGRICVRILGLHAGEP